MATNMSLSSRYINFLSKLSANCCVATVSQFSSKSSYRHNKGKIPINAKFHATNLGALKLVMVWASSILVFALAIISENLSTTAKLVEKSNFEENRNEVSFLYLFWSNPLNKSWLWTSLCNFMIKRLAMNSS